MTVGALIVRTVNMKMSEGVAVITNSLWSCCHGWAQVGILRDNMSGVRGSMVLMKGRMRVSRSINKSSSGRQQGGHRSFKTFSGGWHVWSRDWQRRG